jgi:hypothetical protein
MKSYMVPLLMLLALGCRATVDTRPPRLPPPVVIVTPGPAPTAAPTIVRAKEVRADRIIARVIYCKELKADDGRVGSVNSSHQGHEGWGSDEINVAELRADEVHAKDVRAGFIQADEVRCKEVKIQAEAANGGKHDKENGKGKGKGKGLGHGAHAEND